MSGVKHTPGPWERLEGVVEVGHPIYKPGTVVTRIVQKRAPDQTEFVKVALVDTGPANARLIAAAPELLEALAVLVTDCSQIWSEAEFPALKQARAAIARARGEQDGGRE